MQKQVTAKDLSVMELKALGFDKKNQVEILQQELHIINTELQSRATQLNETKPMEENAEIVPEIEITETVETVEEVSTETEA